MAEDSLGDGGTGAAGDAVLGLFQQRDESGAAGLGLGELYRGLDLGQHGAGANCPSASYLRASSGVR